MNIRQFLKQALCIPENYDKHDYNTQRYSFNDIESLIEDFKKHTGIKDRNGNEIKFGDTLRFADKVEWYKREYTVRVAMGIMTKSEALAEIQARPYHDALVEGIEDYEWLLSDEIQTYWEIVQ